MSRGIVIVGCGGFGREVLALLRALQDAGEQWDIHGFLDDSPSDEDLERLRVAGTRCLGSVADLPSLDPACSVVVGVGSPTARRAIDARIDPAHPRPVLVHPAATVGDGVILGEGTVIAAGARLSTAIVVERQVQVDQNVTVGHDVHIGDYARLNPQACVSGSVTIGAGTLVGANATILQMLTVGPDAVVGAGAVVTRDVPAKSTVKGVPAK